MRYILAIVLFCFTQSMASAQTFEAQLPMVCAPTGALLKELKDTYKEELTWLGNSVSDASYLAVFSDVKTGAWTVVKFNTNSACIVGVGTDSKLIFNNPV